MIPTSNHNVKHGLKVNSKLYIFWFLHQTTTRLGLDSYACLLYIFWFLHQTTTLLIRMMINICCISFDSYIKPQQKLHCWERYDVVYLLIPTSNHNFIHIFLGLYLLYIFWFLHQTTTGHLCSILSLCCISFDSYIKPQPSLFGVLPL